jgi:hypothetical protein
MKELSSKMTEDAFAEEVVPAAKVDLVDSRKELLQ